jgi:DNA topoisomerase-1
MAINLDVANPNWLHEIQVEIEKSQYGPPGPPPRPGLTWRVETHRWIRPPGIQEARFHVVATISEDEAKRMIKEMKVEATPVSKKYGDDRVDWSTEVFSEALEVIRRGKPMHLRFRGGYVEAHTAVYANDQGIPEVTSTWAIYSDDVGGKALAVEFLATNPKNLKESTSKNKAHGMGTAAMYKIFEEAVKAKVDRIILVPLYDSPKFYKKLGFNPTPEQDRYWTDSGYWSIPIAQAKARLIEEGMLQKGDELDDIIAAEEKYGCLAGQEDSLKKARGVPVGPGPQPGPPPRPGLTWGYSQHRWLRPGKGQSKTKGGLPIPPGWTDVWINDDPTADVQARGRDSQGRSVKLTTSEHKDKATAAIFARVKELTPHVLDLRAKFALDADTSEEAAVMYTIAKTGLRIGSDADTKARVKAYGISTLKPEHVKVKGVDVSFDFIAKKGVHLQRTVHDHDLAEIFKNRLSVVDIFDTNDKRVRGYFHTLPGMAKFEPKDFRTYVATQSALREIKRMPAPNDKTMYTKQRMEVGKIVAVELGNTPATALKYYIPQEVFLDWQSGIKSTDIKKSFDGDQAMRDFVETTIYAEDIPWEDLPFEDPDDDDDSVDEIIKARKYKKPEDSKPPEDPPMDQKIGGQGGAASLDLSKDVHKSLIPGRRFMPSKPISKFYDETPDAKVVYTNWANERFDNGRKVLVEMRYPGLRAVASRDTGDVNVWFADDPKIKTNVLPEISEDLRQIGLDFILDGQVMLYRGDKPTDKVRMMRLGADEIHLDPDERVVMALFDILFLKKDVSELPLIERKRILRKFYNDHLVDSDNFVLVEPSLVSDKTSFINAVKSFAAMPGSEGAMIKDASSSYSQGLTDDWAKVQSKMKLKVKVLKKAVVGASFVYTCGVLIDE